MTGLYLRNLAGAILYTSKSPDQVWLTYASGERVAGPPVAVNDDALISMIRTLATRGGQTARDFSAAAPLVNVALTGSARLTATMSVTPRPCVSPGGTARST
jgi:hypothetical protein